MFRFLASAAFAFGLAAACGPAHARDMQLTIYDDGRSCPGDCDAHVVINAADNGTRYAFRPDTQRSSPRPCVDGEMCRICFGEADSSCMTARYRGAGPPVGKFDFTPAFYDLHCPDPAVPAALRAQCSSLDRAVADRGYDTRINCITHRDDARCRAVIDGASRRVGIDKPKRDLCLSMGQARFNQRQQDRNERRANACNYSDLRLGGPNSRGLRWRLLLPAACRDGTFVGRDGFDCCSLSARFAASVHPECTAFYPRPN